MKMLVGILGQSNEAGANTESSVNAAFGVPTIDPISPYGGIGSAWPHLSDLAGRRGDFLSFRNHARGATSLCDVWVGRCRNYSVSMAVGCGAYVIDAGNLYKAVGAISGAYVLNVAPSSGVGTSGLTSWTNLGAVTAEDVNGAVYTESSARFDPNGLILALWNDLSVFTGFDKKAVFVSIGQGDKTFSSTRLQYNLAMQVVARYFSAKRVYVFLGFTCYGATAGLDAYYTSDLLPGRQDALTALASNNYVKAGANLRESLGVLPILPSYGQAGLLADLLHMNQTAQQKAALAWDTALASVTYNGETSKLGVYADGVKFKRNGQDYIGYGVNHFSLFLEQFGVITNSNYIADIDAIAANHIPFVRMPVAPFAYGQWKTYYSDNKANYFKQLDKIIDYARVKNVGLVLSLSWGLREIPKAMYSIYSVSETPNSLINQSSKSYMFFRQFIIEVVNRYKDYDNVLIWELGNEDTGNIGAEYHSSWNVDGTTQAWIDWGVKPEGGTYSAADKLSMSDWISFTGNIVTLIKSIDNHNRAISSGGFIGNNFAAKAQLANTFSSDSFAERDNFNGTGLNWEQYKDQSFDILSSHIYPQTLADAAFFVGDQKTAAQLVSIHKTWANNVDKPFFLGEFGASYLYPDAISTNLPTETTNFNEILNSVVASGVMMSCVWTYDGSAGNKEANPWMKYNIVDTDRQYQLSAISALNIALGH